MASESVEGDRALRYRAGLLLLTDLLTHLPVAAASEAMAIEAPELERKCFG